MKAATVIRHAHGFESLGESWRVNLFCTGGKFFLQGCILVLAILEGMSTNVPVRMYEYGIQEIHKTKKIQKIRIFHFNSIFLFIRNCDAYETFSVVLVILWVVVFLKIL